MSLITWFLTRVTEDPDGQIEINNLYDAYEFEMKESSVTKIASKRVFTEHIMIMYPSVEKKRIQKERQTTITIYRGINLVPVNVNSTQKAPIQLCDVKETLQIKNFRITEEGSDVVTCYMDTGTLSNGNSVGKTITFMANGKWNLHISGHEVDLDQMFISNSFTSDREGIDLVLNIAAKVNLCEGIAVTSAVIMTRFHTLENWTSQGHTKRLLRSKLCNRVVPFYPKNSSCIKCRRMTLCNPSKNFEKENPEKDDGQTTGNKPENTSKLHPKQIEQLIPGATPEMIELLSNQSLNASRDPRGRRWTEGVMNVCLQWYCRSPQSYEGFRDSKFLILPHKSTLIQYKSRIRHNTGFDDHIFDWMLEAARQRCTADHYYGGVIIDEMAIQSDIQICKNKDVIELSGFTDVGTEANVCHTLRKGKNEQVLGTHALQFVFLGLNGFRFPFAHFISDGVQAQEIYPLFWEAVARLRLFGFVVSFICMDGAQSNRSFMHINTNAERLFTSENPCSFGKMVYIMDCKHVLKKIRNNVLKSGVLKSSTRLLTLPTTDTIQWQMFEDCYKWDRRNALQLHRKLTDEHFYLSNQLKMRNHLAEEVLDEDMLHLMLQYQQSLGEKGSVLNGAVELLRQTSVLVNIFKDMKAIKSLDDPRLELLHQVAVWFEDWTCTALSDPSKPMKEKHKLIMSTQCHEDIQSCIIGFCQLCRISITPESNMFITPGLINSDVVENTFNQQRSTYHGSNTNPNALQYRQALNSIILGQTSVSQKGNAGKSRAAAVPYHCTMKSTVKSSKRKSEATSYRKIKVIRL